MIFTAITTVLFDLDGTLLPMDQDVFVAAYFKKLAVKLAPHGYDPKELIDAIWMGTGAMITNNGSCSNETAFWNVFCKKFGKDARKDEPIFEEYYKTDFQSVKDVCGFDPVAAETINALKEKGLRLILATNPIFPAIATQSRVRWAGLDISSFEHYTTYENSSYCKPNLDYFREIMAKCKLKAEECLMVGNDVGDDMVTRELGMKVFLLTDCLINKKDVDINQYPHGGFAELMEYINTL